jgi:hypothetical protein
MRKLALIVPIAAVLFAPSWLRADGCNPNTQDCGGYKDEAPIRPRARAQVYSYAYSIRPARGNWACPSELSRRECRRIQAEVDARRAREIRRAVPRSRYAEIRTPRELRDVDPGPERRSFGGKRCAGYFSVKGDARWTEAFARGSALKEWRKVVRTSVGESYIDEHYSPNFRVGKCQIVGDRGINKRCVAEGTACRP